MPTAQEIEDCKWCTWAPTAGEGQICPRCDFENATKRARDIYMRALQEEANTKPSTTTRQRFREDYEELQARSIRMELRLLRHEHTRMLHSSQASTGEDLDTARTTSQRITTTTEIREVVTTGRSNRSQGQDYMQAIPPTQAYPAIQQRDRSTTRQEEEPAGRTTPTPPTSTLRHSRATKVDDNRAAENKGGRRGKEGEGTNPVPPAPTEGRHDYPCGSTPAREDGEPVPTTQKDGRGDYSNGSTPPHKEEFGEIPAAQAEPAREEEEEGGTRHRRTTGPEEREIPGRRWTGANDRGVREMDWADGRNLHRGRRGAEPNSAARQPTYPRTGALAAWVQAGDHNRTHTEICRITINICRNLRRQARNSEDFDENLEVPIAEMATMAKRDNDRHREPRIDRTTTLEEWQRALTNARDSRGIPFFDVRRTRRPDNTGEE